MKIVSLVAVTLGLVCAPAAARAADYLIHVGGMCSATFTDGDTRLGAVPGWISIDAPVDMSSDLDQAVDDLRAVVDAHCLAGTGNRCRLYGYSNGGAAISKLLSVYGMGQWNLTWAMHAGSNEGGSELSKTGWVAELIGGCDIANEIDPTTHRSGWNHHDTDGLLIYQVAGRRGLLRSLYATSLLLPGADDGAVAMHSGGGYAAVSSQADACGPGRWENHVAAYHCAFDNDHYEMKTKGLRCLEQQASGVTCSKGD